jgi:type I restriction enzyme S subunit
LIPKPDDILVTARGTLGLCYIVKEADKFYFQDGMISWISKQEVEFDSVYLAHLFCTDKIRKQIEQASAGTAVGYLSITALSYFKIPLPPLSLQHRFADFVHATDQVKSDINRSLEKLELLYDALMQNYFGKND